MDLLSCASLTNFTIWERKVSSPVFSTSILIDPSPFIDPPITLLPSPFEAGFDSPVIIASLMDVFPSYIFPSAGIFSPGFINNLSLCLSSETGTSATFPPSVI